MLLMIALPEGAGLFGQAPPVSLAVTGDVATPLMLTARDLAALPRETVKVPGRGGAEISYEGVLLREILAKAGAPLGGSLRGKALASYILAKARDGYQVVFTLGEIDPQFGAQRILVVDRRDGQPLPQDQGPLRIICPGDQEGARSVRMLEELEIVRLRK